MRKDPDWRFREIIKYIKGIRKGQSYLRWHDELATDQDKDYADVRIDILSDILDECTKIGMEMSIPVKWIDNDGTKGQ